MLRESQFDFERPLTGLEIELNLVDEPGRPGACATPRCSRRSPTPDFQTELGQFNVEINVPPRLLAGDVGRASWSRASGTRLNHAEEQGPHASAATW